MDMNVHKSDFVAFRGELQCLGMRSGLLYWVRNIGFDPYCEWQSDKSNWCRLEELRRDVVTQLSETSAVAICVIKLLPAY